MNDSVTTGASSAAAPSAAPSTPSSATPAPSTPASATATPASDSSASAPGPQGPIPFDRHEAILKGAYTERDAAQQALKAHETKYGWAPAFERDPYTFVDSWIDQLAAHPQYQAQLLNKAARLLQARRGQAAPAVAEEPPPDVPITDGQGNVTGQTYSAKQLKAWQQWDWSQKQQALDQRMAPLEQLRSQVEHAQMTAEIQQQADSRATATLTELRRDTYFVQHEPAVKQALMAHPEWGDDVYRAYHHVLQTVVFPSIGQTAETKVLDHLKTQAAGGSVAPGQMASTQTPKFKDFGDALRYYEAHPQEAEAMAKR